VFWGRIRSLHHGTALLHLPYQPPGTAWRVSRVLKRVPEEISIPDQTFILHLLHESTRTVERVSAAKPSFTHSPLGREDFPGEHRFLTATALPFFICYTNPPGLLGG
jgi:hypothetical protein